MKKAVEKKGWIAVISSYLLEVFFVFIRVGADAYWRIYWYVRKGEYLKTHLVFEREGWHVKISIKKHREFVEDVEQKIADYEGSRRGTAFIRFALDQALTGCAAIKISQGKEFIQFWTGRGYLDCRILIGRRKKENKAYYCILGLLADNNYVRDSFNPGKVTLFAAPEEYHKYKMKLDGNLAIIEPYFDRNVHSAASFVTDFFTYVYRDTKEDYLIEVA